jgi:DNA-binding MarR family transcriptional regulator
MLDQKRYRLISTSEHILCLLLNAGTYVNHIVKQTSSDRTYVLWVISYLQGEGLISESRDPTHLQKKIKNLTPLGREIAELIKSIAQYSKSYEELHRRGESYYYSIKYESSKSSERYNKQINPATLQSRKSKSKTAEMYKRYVKGIAILEYETADYIKNLVIFRCSSLLRRFNIKPVTQLVLNHIIMSTTELQIYAMLDNIEQIHDPSKLIDEFIEHAKRIAELPKQMVGYGLLDNKSTSKEAKGVLLSVLPILKSQKQSIQENRRHQKQLWEDLDKKIHEVKAKLSMPDKLYPEEDSPNQQEVKALYEEIRKALS